MTGTRVYLRNAHPERAVALPLGTGSYRMLAPGVTTAVPATVAKAPAVSRLLVDRAVTVVGTAPNSTGWNAEARQRRADQLDMAQQIARAEQRAFDRLLQGLPEVRKRPAGRAGEPYALLRSAGLAVRITITTMRQVLAGEIALPTSLQTLVPSEWGGRGAARQLLEAAQRQQGLSAPKAAAWIATELAAVVPTAPLLRWSPAEDALLRQRRAARVPEEQIADEIGVSVMAVKARARRLGLPSYFHPGGKLLRR